MRVGFLLVDNIVREDGDLSWVLPHRQDVNSWRRGSHVGFGEGTV